MEKNVRGMKVVVSGVAEQKKNIKVIINLVVQYQLVEAQHANLCDHVFGYG